MQCTPIPAVVALIAIVRASVSASFVLRSSGTYKKAQRLTTMTSQSQRESISHELTDMDERPFLVAQPHEGLVTADTKVTSTEPLGLAQSGNDGYQEPVSIQTRGADRQQQL
jgi:hypothetical protein